MNKLLVINPGSTSTKIGVFEDEREVFVKNITHETSLISQFDKITDQYEFRYNTIADTLKDNGFNIEDFTAIVGRGGLVKPIKSGTYEVNDAMISDLKKGVQGQHASNLGGLIADKIAKSINAKAYIVDPVVVDELDDVARISGNAKFERRSIFHALNQKAIAKQYAKDIDKDYNDLNLIVVHMGGGVSVGIHKKGKVVDVNNALDGEGAFSPERSGTLPMGDIIDTCFSNEYTKEEVKKMVVGKGGLVSYFGSNNTKELVDESESDATKRLVIDAMIFQIAKEIGAYATVVDGDVDAILLTGGIAYSKYITDGITKKVSYISKVNVYAGEDELKALAQGALRVINNIENCKVY